MGLRRVGHDCAINFLSFFLFFLHVEKEGRNAGYIGIRISCLLAIGDLSQLESTQKKCNIILFNKFCIEFLLCARHVMKTSNKLYLLLFLKSIRKFPK